MELRKVAPTSQFITLLSKNIHALSVIRCVPNALVHIQTNAQNAKFLKEPILLKPIHAPVHQSNFLTKNWTNAFHAITFAKSALDLTLNPANLAKVTLYLSRIGQQYAFIVATSFQDTFFIREGAKVIFFFHISFLGCHPDCLRCVEGTDSDCELCSNTVLVQYKGKCIGACPPHFYAYQGICYGKKLVYS